MSLTQGIHQLGRVIEHKSTFLLTTVIITGSISGVLFGIDGGLKAAEIIRQQKCETNKEKFKATWKCYIPAGVACATTIGCVIFLNKINERKTAALAGLYSIAQSTLREYREKVIETIGENKERKIQDGIASDKIANNPPTDIIYAGSGSVLAYDAMSGRYFNADIEKIRKLINELNRRLMTEMFISLNDFYYELGLGPIKLGDDLGFNMDIALLDVKFSSQLTPDDKPCLVLTYDVHQR